MREAGFGLGSNIGDSVGVIAQALERLFAHPDIAFRACSSFYRTAPWGHTDQPAFVNLCAAGGTDLSARELLAAVKEIERELGRQQTFRWGPRVIDIDILYLGDESVDEAGMTVPHAGLFERGFVLRPLAEIRPDAFVAGRRIATEARRFADDEMPVVGPPWAPHG